MGFFDKLIKGLKRTKEAFSKKIYQLFSGRELNDEFYEDLENTLISSDLGVEATEQIIEEFKDACFKKKIKKTDDAKDLLKSIMIDAINYDIEEYSYPLVILVAGVNGLRLWESLPSIFVIKARALCLPLQTLSELRLANS